MENDSAITPAAVNVEVVVFDYESVEPEYRTMIESRTQTIKERIRKTAQDIVEIGEMLTDVKECLPHGQFTLWLQIEFGWDVRSAQRFMSVAAMFKSDTVSHFSKDLLSKASIDQSALYILAAKSTPQTIRQEILERAYQGEPFTKSKVKKIVADGKTKRSRLANPRKNSKTKPYLAIGMWVRIQTLEGNKNWDRRFGRIVAEPEFSKYGVRINETTERCLRFYPEELTPVLCPPGQLVIMRYPGRAGKEHTQYNGCWAIVEDVTDTGNLTINLAGKITTVMKTDVELADNPPSDYKEIIQKINQLLAHEKLDGMDRRSLDFLLRQSSFTTKQLHRLDQIYTDYFTP